jgi:Spy/CpxP family protein refolding chaperone
MARSLRLAAVALVALAAAASSSSANAQVAGFIRLFRPYHQVVLAQLDEVAKDLKLTDDQKKKVVELDDKLNEERRALWEEAAGDFDSIREPMNKLNAEIATDLAKELDDAQKTRLAQIYVQANGPAALFDPTVAGELKITDEQSQKLLDLRNANRTAFQDVDWQNISPEEAEKEIDTMIDTQNKEYAAILTEEQRAAFEKMQGEKLEIDLTKLPNPFGG